MQLLAYLSEASLHIKLLSSTSLHKLLDRLELASCLLLCDRAAHHGSKSICVPRRGAARVGRRSQSHHLLRRADASSYTVTLLHLCSEKTDGVDHSWARRLVALLVQLLVTAPETADGTPLVCNATVPPVEDTLLRE